jgi:ribonuclease HII
MRRAIEQLPTPCDCLLIDALEVDVDLPQKPLIRGDALSFSIAAASILAKTARDAAMEAWDGIFPHYGFKNNKGYSTPDHIEALQRHGPTSLHRFSFEPVRESSRCWTWDGYPIPLGQPLQQELFES